jgi:hypothetical protein
MGEPAIMSLFLLVAAGGVTGWLATIVRQRELRALRTREWIEYLQQDLLT